MRAIPKVLTITTLSVGLAISTSPAQAALPVVPALELLEKIPISEEVSMDTFEPESWAPDPEEEPGYYRASGCTAVQDTLIRDTEAAGQQLAEDGCTLLVGDATDPYSGDFMEYDWQEDTDEAQLAVDHVVSVGEAHRSGGGDWPAGRQLTFYNGGENLVAVSAVEHQAKAGADITEYLPPNPAVRCAYVATTVYIKHRYELTMDQAEHDVAHSVLSDEQCGIVGALPAKTLTERVTEKSPMDWVQDNSSVIAAVSIGLIAVAVLSGWMLQRKQRSAKKS